MKGVVHESVETLNPQIGGYGLLGLCALALILALDRLFPAVC
jgi:hypothetical protein